MPRRVVSLVPSVTETLLALGVRPVACTRFCEQPDLRHVGGTKDPDIEAIVALAPDLVVVNDEENRREDADALMDRGLALHVMSPRRVAEVPDAVARLAVAVGVTPPPMRLPPPRGSHGRVAAFVWRRPWMALGPDTFGASMLEHLGYATAWAPTDERYPVVALTELRALRPDLVVLPSEPYPFAERHRAEVGDAVPRARIALVDGQDLFWWGARTPQAIVRLGRALA